jgi:KUP system potassium uptake protein
MTGDKSRLAVLSLAALGIVYGDIGTSPLYALREAFLPAHGVSAAIPRNVLGVLSLIFWSLILIISFKYLIFVLRADHQGEGGAFALTALITPSGAIKRSRWVLIGLGLFGAALLYGDGMITPAISVLSAVEGLSILTPALEPVVIPTTVAILAALILLQKRGTAGIGVMFGPVVLLWFLMIAALGAVQIVQEPAVLFAVSPHHAFDFIRNNGHNAMLVLGSVVLVVTGGEALYADMGHLGPKPIRLMWFSVVLPALLLNYFGQGALVLRVPAAIENPFYLMAPQSLLLPVIVVSTAATVIASQALISGAFSLTLQAVQMGYSPRVRIEHTSADQYGQIFIPAVNWALMLACIGLVVGFRSASNLAAAYGVAVTGTMTITTILLYKVAREQWKWNVAAASALTAFLLIIDLSFLFTNLSKVPMGGWFPLAVGAVVFTLLTTWKRGRAILNRRMNSRTLPRELFVESIRKNPPLRVPGTAVFMYRIPGVTPPALLHNLKHNKVLHEQVVFLSVVTEGRPQVALEDRLHVEQLGNGLYQMVLRYGFMESVHLPQVLGAAKVDGLTFKPMETTYFLARETLLASERPGMAVWRARLFSVLARNERPATSFFHLPPNRVVEMGAQIEL